MHELLPHLRGHFDGLTDRFKCFATHAVQVEGWFKGELLCVLERLQNDDVIESFGREVKVPGGRVDVTVSADGLKHWIELKHWLIGRQDGVRYGASFYFGDRTDVGITRDVDKLLGVEDPGERWILLLLPAKPEAKDWNGGLRRFNEKCVPRRLLPCSRLDEFTEDYFLGLLRVERESE